ncbi:MAG: polysaccharide deacetylase family protein [Acidobacteria bacterium]|nr:polysaccharide deacetylase family protein [Acidobacteriota bacterium]MBI3427953.1 polysaccharide deacetylase family protein [Acidobacteriota bacterium]
MTKRLLLTAAAAGLLAAIFVADQRTQALTVPPRYVAVTIDDLPLQQQADLVTARALTAKLLQTLTANRIPAIGFVNEGKLHVNNDGELAARTGLLKLWLDAGLDLGNHSYSHLRYYSATLEQMQADTLRGEAVTKRLLAERGKTMRYFRHPTLNTGKDLAAKEAFEKFLASHGYTVAPVTIDNSEWLFASEYAKARQRGDAATMKKIAAAYVPYMEEVFAFYERLSRDTLGYEIKQTLLVHANALNAEHFGAVVALLKRRGYQFISLEEALTDKAYSLPDTYTGPVGISWLQRWAISKGGQMRPEPELPPVMKAFDDPQVSGSDYKSAKTPPASRKKGKQQ